MRSELPTLVGGIGLDSGLGQGADSFRGPVVGREAEMHLLAQALERTRVRGEPASITLLGPKNAGKTRVLQAFAEGARKLDNPEVRVMECAALDGDAPFGIFARLLRDRFQLRDEMTDDEVRSELRARVADVLGDRKVGDVLYFLGRMLDVHFPDSPITRAIDGTAEFDVVARAVARSFFEADARRGPLCLVIEDVHLCEDDSLALLRYLVESVDAPFFVVCSARTELLGRAIAWARSERHKLVHLSPQSHDETAVAARIAVLLPEELALLEGAALMGSVFWAGALVALERASMTAPDFWDPQSDEPLARRLLASLAERDYVLKLPDSTFPGDEEYIFKHSLEREKISNSTRPDTARRLARTIADWLERQPALREYEENLCMLAGHRQRAGMPAAGGRAYLEAGDVAKKRDAITAAADCYAKGLALLGEEEPVARLEALRSLSAILVRQSKGEVALRRFGEMAALAFRLHAPAVGAEAHAGIARLKAAAGDAIAAVRHMRAAVGLYAQAGADEAVGGATAELDKLMDQIAAASARRGPESKVNGTSSAAPVAMAAASDSAPAVAAGAIATAAAGVALAATDAGGAAAAAGEVAGEVSETGAAVATPDAGTAGTTSSEPTGASSEVTSVTSEAIGASSELTSASSVPTLVQVAPQLADFSKFGGAVDSMPTLVRAVDARSLEAAMTGNVEALSSDAAGATPIESSAEATEVKTSDGTAEVSAPVTGASTEASATAAEISGASESLSGTPIPTLSTFDTGTESPTFGGSLEARVDAALAAASEPMLASAESVPTQRAPAPAADSLDEPSTFDRPTPPAPFPAVAALAAESAHDDTRTRGSGKFDAGSAAVASRAGELVDDDPDAVDIEWSDEGEAESVADWIDLKGTDPAMAAVRTAGASAGAAAPITPSSDGADSDVVPTVRKVFVASEAPEHVAAPQAEAGSADAAAEWPVEEPQTPADGGESLAASQEARPEGESAPHDGASAGAATPGGETDRDASADDADRDALPDDATRRDALPAADAPNADTSPSDEEQPASEGRPSADTLPSLGTVPGSTTNGHVPPGESEYGISPPSGDLEDPESK